MFLIKGEKSTRVSFIILSNYLVYGLHNYILKTLKPKKGVT